ncbi:unnamed protein product [Ambrosiozyma monospora]|uniref:Unnamed protein product n=1 Tax=Ambrosiozyma monospora TaxID=43982 RepID=A0A9W6SWJ6_AMBMO|nr:unnamed protein product [Ambrosiozyma monospora]
MQESGKKYGFTIAIKELVNTVPNLFRYTKAFIKKYNVELPDTWRFFSHKFDFYEGKNAESYVSVRGEKDLWKTVQDRVPMYHALEYMKQPGVDREQLDQYSIDKLVDHSNKKGIPLGNKDQFERSEFTLCHFWSNFEIARTDLFTSPEYRAYFNFLENSKGFYTERWGDAPIHSLAAGLFLNTSEIHYFRDIGYKHSTLGHCPHNSPNQLPYEEGPNYRHSYTAKEEKFWAAFDKPVEKDGVGTGCRCVCPTNSKSKDIENSGGSCIKDWAALLDDDQEGRFHFDLDVVEEQALKMYREYLKSHGGNGEGWVLSQDQIDELRENIIWH